MEFSSPGLPRERERVVNDIMAQISNKIIYHPYRLHRYPSRFQHLLPSFDQSNPRGERENFVAVNGMLGTALTSDKIR